MGLSKVALVGMSCQASVTGALEARRVNKWRKKIAWTFGLLCSKTFTYDGLMDEIAQRELGLDLDHLARVNVKGKLLFYTDTGDEVTYSLKDAHRFTRPGCLQVPGLRRGARRHLLRGTRPVRRLDPHDRAHGPREGPVGRGRSPTASIEARPATEDPAAVDLMFKLAARSRRRWPGAEEVATAGRRRREHCHATRP